METINHSLEQVHVILTVVLGALVICVTVFFIKITVREEKKRKGGSRW